MAAYLFSGCYERFLLGYTLPLDLTQDGQLVKKYTFAAHRNAVRCVATAGQYLVSGGADDTIHMYDLKSQSDLGSVMNPGEGAVPCLALYTPVSAYNPTHMLTGSADGALCIWSAGRNWDVLKVMKGHRGAVNALAVHSSGRLALTTSRDCSIRMWNLVKGRCSYTSKLDLEGDSVSFCPSGARYSLVCGSKVTLHDASGEGGLLSSFTSGRRVLCTAQQHDDILLAGCEDGGIVAWDVRSGGRGRPHRQGSRDPDPRLGGALSGCARPAAPRHASPRGDAMPHSLAAASSDGIVKVWDTRMLGAGSGGDGSGSAAAAASSRAVPIASVSTGARITCLCVTLPAPPVVLRAVEPPSTADAAHGGVTATRAAAHAQADKGQSESKKRRKAAAKQAQAQASSAVPSNEQPAPAAAVTSQAANWSKKHQLTSQQAASPGKSPRPNPHPSTPAATTNQGQGKRKGQGQQQQQQQQNPSQPGTAKHAKGSPAVAASKPVDPAPAAQKQQLQQTQRPQGNKKRQLGGEPAPAQNSAAGAASQEQQPASKRQKVKGKGKPQ
ncbi:MAG: hypothetical protein WDW36_004697 [Sanguina aurantia]